MSNTDVKDFLQMANNLGNHITPRSFGLGCLALAAFLALLFLIAINPPDPPNIADLSGFTATAFGLASLGVLLGIYFLPAIVAAKRGHRQSTAILILNLFLGWTLIGWVAALVWANTN